ncbi:MAG: NYN domain-containing protein [Thermodesulfobacteriota bacterium]
MAIRIVIDGYNLIGASTGMGLSVRDIEAQREALVKRLIPYRKTKGAKLAVIFDGAGMGRLSRSREMKDGVEIIFSRAGETADSVLKEYAERFREGLTLVTSDRDVATFAMSKNTVVISSDEFLSILGASEYEDMKGVIEEDEEEERKDKKGAGRKLPKKERLKEKRLKKL